MQKNTQLLMFSEISPWELGEIAQWEQSQWEKYTVTALLQPAEVCILLSMIKCSPLNSPLHTIVFFFFLFAQ